MNISTNKPVEITETSISETGLYVDAKCGKVSALIAIHEDRVQIICKNASHRVWRGSGKFFGSIAEAVGAYKSPEMKAIIQTADSLNR